MKKTCPVTWGILGAAFIAEKEFIPAVLDSPVSKLIAIASRSEEKAARLALKFGIPFSYGSYEELLEDKNVEAVYIPLPNHLHAAYAIKALEAGKHVLVEKPAVISMEELDRVFKIATKNKLIFTEAFMFRYHDGVKQILDYIKKERLGEVRSVSAQLWINLKTQPKNIRLLNLPGSGAILDLGIYTLECVRRFSHSEPEMMDGYALYKKESKKTDVAFSASMIMKNGVLGSIQGGFISARKAPGIYCPATILLDKAEIQLPNFLSNKEQYQCIIHSNDDKKEIVFTTKNYYQHEINDFVNAVRGRPSNIALKEDIAAHLRNLFTLSQRCYRNKINSGSAFEL